jgi:hypothetical protein
MFQTRWQHLFRRPAPVSAPRYTSVRPGVEVLEERAAPSSVTVGGVTLTGPLNTNTQVTGISSAYGLLSQTETVNVHVSSPSGATVNEGQVTVTDAGHSQTVNVNSSGDATAKFTFNLFQEQPLPHDVSAAYNDNTSTGLFASSSGTGTAPNTTGAYFVQLYIDFYLISLFSSSGSSSGSSSNSGGNQ